MYRRCGCRGPDGRQLGRHCPDLRDERHGTWTLDLRIPGPVGAGKARRLRRGGYATRAQADRARKNLLSAPTRRQRAAAWTTSSWLHHWLEAEQRWRDTTRRSYASHVVHYLEPYLGRVPLDELATWQVQAMFDDLARNPSPSGHMLAPATLVRLQATLRASLNAALRAGILETNPARWLRLPPHPHIRAEIWTPGRVAVWQATGARPAAEVWTPEHLAQFLENRAAVGDPLLPLWRVIGLRGLRRGEACGLRWEDVDLDDGTGHGTIRIVQALVDVAGRSVVAPPKTAASRRLITLDAVTTRCLSRLREGARDAHYDHRYVFTDGDGRPLRPERATRAFHKAVEESGLPPVRLHDLRHGAANLALAAGADLKTLQELLGHSTIITTADIYAHVLPVLHSRAADAVAELVDNADRRRIPLNDLSM
ncbi:MAG: site-specific integrase [Actinobacteria bacterium]|nr:site-specific integrase [Actinomycetota bacterium]